MNYPYAVKKAYVARFTQDWSEPARDLFKRMDSAFLKELRQLVQLHFGLYSPGDLDNAIRCASLILCYHLRSTADILEPV
jgi:hypothetical protein